MTAPTDNAALRAAQIVRDFQTVADADFLSAKSRIEAGAQGLEMALAVAMGMAHQARQILQSLAAAIPPEQDGYAEGRAREVLQQAAIASGEFASISFEPTAWNPWPIAIRAMLAFATDRHAEGRIAGLEEAAKAGDDELIHQALQFLFWGVGEGFIAAEEAFWDYSKRTGDEDWETLAERYKAHASRVGDRRGE